MCPLLLVDERKGRSESGLMIVPLELLIDPAAAEGNEEADKVDAVFEYWGGADDGTSDEDDTGDEKEEKEDDDEDAADGTIDDDDERPGAPWDKIDGGNWVESGKVANLWCARESLWIPLVVRTGLDCV